MSDGLNALKDEDIQKLVRLIESLESSAFDYLQLQVGDVKVTIGKGAVPLSAHAAVPAAHTYASAPAASAPHVAQQAAPPLVGAAARAHGSAQVAGSPGTAAPAARARNAPSAASASGGTIEIKAQIMGMFYAQPEPGAPPFVSVGAEVKEDSTVCLIEVMKTFNAMTAGVKGVITEVCAENAQLVEYGQVLFRVRPA